VTVSLDARAAIPRTQAPGRGPCDGRSRLALAVSDDDRPVTPAGAVVTRGNEAAAVKARGSIRDRVSPVPVTARGCSAGRESRDERFHLASQILRVRVAFHEIHERTADHGCVRDFTDATDVLV